MTTVRRLLTLLSVALVVFAGVALILFMASDAPRRPVPLPFILFMVAMPSLAHIVSSVLSWAPRQVPPSRKQAVVGLASATVASFVWLLMYATGAYLGTRGSVRGIPPVVLMFGLAAVVVPVASIAHAVYFGRTLADHKADNGL